MLAYHKMQENQTFSLLLRRWMPVLLYVTSIRSDAEWMIQICKSLLPYKVVPIKENEIIFHILKYRKRASNQKNSQLCNTNINKKGDIWCKAIPVQVKKHLKLVHCSGGPLFFSRKNKSQYRLKVQTKSHINGVMLQLYATASLLPHRISIGFNETPQSRLIPIQRKKLIKWPIPK